MDNSDEATAIQRIVRAAAELRTFSRSELSDKAGTKPSTTRVVLKRLQDQWPEALAVEKSETKQGKAGGFNRYTVGLSFAKVEERYNYASSQSVRGVSTEHVLTEFVELGLSYLELAENAETKDSQRKSYLAKAELLLSKANRDEAKRFPDIAAKFIKLDAHLKEVKRQDKSSQASQSVNAADAPVDALKLVQMKSRRQRSPQKKIEERIADFCRSFATLDLSVLTFEQIIYPVFSEILDRTSIRNIAGSVNDDLIAAEVWNRQLEINTNVKSNIRRNVIAHLMSDDIKGKAAYEAIVVRDGDEREAFQTAMEINRAWLSNPSNEHKSKLAWKIGDHRVALPDVVMSPAWYTFRREALRGNYFRVSFDWLNLLDDDLQKQPFLWNHHVKGLDRDAKASASLALLAIADLEPFSRNTLQYCVRNSMVHSLGHAVERTLGGQGDGFRLLHGHSASVLVDRSADLSAGLSISSWLQHEGMICSTAMLDFLNPAYSTLMGSAQDFSPTMLLVAIDSSRMGAESVEMMEQLRNSSCVFVDVGGASHRDLPIDPHHIVRVHSRDDFRFQALVEAATTAVATSSGEDFELYGPADSA